MTLNLPNEPIRPISEPSIHPYKLGASLYMPATRGDLWQIICREKLTNIDSVIFCLEDAIRENEVETAIQNIQQLLINWQKNPPKKDNRPLVFIRPRHAQMLHQMADWQGMDLIDGFVLPKVDLYSLADWRLACQNLATSHFLMPTLETNAIFNPTHNQELAQNLVNAFNQQILALRIGGNDLLACLRLRRPPHTTIYDTPIGILIYQLLGCFVPYGFYLTAPVFEFLDKNTLFTQEIQQDIAIGLVGKTIIHPSQADIVKQNFMVENQTLAQAKAILDPNAKAVFKQDNTMLEPATHKAWANMVMARYQHFNR